MVVYECIDDEDFIKKSEHGIGKRVIVYFYQQRCLSCLRIKPLVDELCKKYNDTIVYTFEYYNDDQLTGEAFEISTVPAFVVMDNGEELHRYLGAEKEKVTEVFQKYAV